MRRHRRSVPTLLAAVLALAGLTAVGDTIARATGAGAVVLTPPDLKILVPTDDISIGTDPDTGHRQLQFTHITWDAGAGPFAIKPRYNARTGISTFVQYIYRNGLAGGWALDHKVPLAVNGIFDPPSDYRYPLTRFTLHTANGNGTPGALVALSPKTDYCITADAFVGGVPRTPAQTSPPQSNCTLRNGLLGFSVGWGDQYDQTDDGQPIDLSFIPDGNYVLHATVDPQHIFTESDATNNVVDTELHINGTNVTVLSQTSPTTVPPTIHMTNPAPGAQVQGTVTLSASVSAAAPATPVSVQYLLDGNPLGSPATSAPFDATWNVGITRVGTHTLAAQVTDSNGNVATSAPETISVVPNTTGGLAIDKFVTHSGHNTVISPAITTTVAGDTLVAFASLDGPNAGGGSQTTTISGAGLTWHRVARENAQLGDAEIWTATAPGLLSFAHVSSKPFVTGFAQQLSVLAFKNAGGTGAAAIASGATGAPTVTLSTSAAGSLSLAVGEDWDRSVPRTIGGGQTMLAQWVDALDGDTFWTQGTTNGSTASGQSVTLSDSAPTDDQWNLAAVEVTPTTPPPAQVVLANPADGQTLSGTVPLAAAVHSAIGLRSVRFVVDGHAVAGAATHEPFAVRWDSRRARNGVHVVAAVATDVDGRVAFARHRIVVRNPARPMTCFIMQVHTSVHGGRRVVTPAFHTAAGGEQLLAFVQSASGTSARATVRGAGLHWRLVRRMHSTTGDVAVWSAVAPRVLTHAIVGSTVARGTQDLTVVAMEGTEGPAASMAASGSHTRRGVVVRTAHPVSLVFAVGVHDGGARHVAAGWSVLSQRVDRSNGRTAWVQYTNQPTGDAPQTVGLPQPAQAPGGWVTIAIELPGDDA